MSKLHILASLGLSLVGMTFTSCSDNESDSSIPNEPAPPHIALLEQKGINSSQYHQAFKEALKPAASCPPGGCNKSDFDIELINALILTGTKLDIPNTCEMYMLGYDFCFIETIVCYGLTECLETALKNGFNPNHTYKGKSSYFNGRTLLHFAYDQPKSLALLIEAGVDIDARDNNGETALIQAARTGNSNSVRLLLKAGANIDVKDRTGMTALKYAEKKGHAACAQMIRMYGSGLL